MSEWLCIQQEAPEWTPGDEMSQMMKCSCPKCWGPVPCNNYFCFFFKLFQLCVACGLFCLFSCARAPNEPPHWRAPCGSSSVIGRQLPCICLRSKPTYWHWQIKNSNCWWARCELCRPTPTQLFPTYPPTPSPTAAATNLLQTPCPIPCITLMQLTSKEDSVQFSLRETLVWYLLTRRLDPASALQEVLPGHLTTLGRISRHWCLTTGLNIAGLQSMTIYRGP